MTIEYYGNVRVEIYREKEAEELITPELLAQMTAEARQRNARTGKPVTSVGRWKNGLKDGIAVLTSHHLHAPANNLTALSFQGPQAEVTRFMAKWIMALLETSDEGRSKTHFSN